MCIYIYILYNHYAPTQVIKRKVPVLRLYHIYNMTFLEAQATAQSHLRIPQHCHAQGVQFESNDPTLAAGAIYGLIMSNR